MTQVVYRTVLYRVIRRLRIVYRIDRIVCRRMKATANTAVPLGIRVEEGCWEYRPLTHSLHCCYSHNMCVNLIAVWVHRILRDHCDQELKTNTQIHCANFVLFG